MIIANPALYDNQASKAVKAFLNFATFTNRNAIFRIINRCIVQEKGHKEYFLI